MKKTLTRITASLFALMAAGQQDDELIMTIDDLTELGTQEALVERLSEHFADDEILITPEVSRVFEAIEANDDDMLRDVLSDIAGEQVSLPSDPVPHEGVIEGTPDRFSSDEILARMRPQHVDALANHRHLLDDKWLLYRHLQNLEGVEHDAAMEFIAKMNKPESIESMMPPELIEELRVAKVRGWRDFPGPAMGSHMLREVASLGSDGQAKLRRTSLEFGLLDENLPEQVESYSFDLPGYERMEVHSNTKFGGVLYVEKTLADHVYYDDPNLIIAGRDALRGHRQARGRRVGDDGQCLRRTAPLPCGAGEQAGRCRAR